MTQEELCKQIVSTMREYYGGKWINPMTATHQCPNEEISEAFDALKYLTKEGIVERQLMQGFPLYRYYVTDLPKPKAV